MKLHLASAGDQNRFTGYGVGYVAVNNLRFERSIVVTPGVIHDNWHVPDVDTLDGEPIDFLIALAPEILLLGTGARQRFPRSALLKSLAAARIGLEVMDTPAACRTYNILSAEGRNVVAAVLVA
jgi:uncharacterized protein